MPSYRPVALRRYRKTTTTTKPNAPALSSPAQGTTTVDLALVAGAAVPGSTRQGFKVYQGGVAVKTLAAFESTAQITGLTAGASYTFTATEVNTNNEDSDPSPAVTVSTLSAQAPRAPGNFRWLSTTATGGTLTWDAAVAPDTDPVIGYRIRRVGQTAILATTNAPALQAGPFTTLTAGDQLQVKAYNSVGQGPASNTVTFTPPSTGGGGGGTPMAAKPAGVVADTYSIAMPKTTGTYSNRATTKAALLDLGVKHARSRYTPASNELVARIKEYCDDLGMRWICRFGAFEESDAAQDTPAELVTKLLADFGPTPTDYVDRIEGWNEPNNNGVAWITRSVSYTKRTWVAVRAQTSLNAVPVLGLSMARIPGDAGGAEGGSQLGQMRNLAAAAEADHGQAGKGLAPWVDEGVTHIYPRGRTPSTDLDLFVGNARSTIYPGRPNNTTEGGYFNDMSFATSNPTPEGVHGIYADRHILEHVLRGHKRFNQHELWDDATGSREGSFGLLRSNGTKKPAYATIKNFLDLFTDENTNKTPKIDNATSPLNLTISPAPGAAGSTTNTLRTALFQHSDGSYRLALWRDVTVQYAATAPYRITPTTAITVTVTLPAARTVTQYTPSKQAAATVAATAANSFTVSLSDNAVIAKLV